MNAVRGAVFFLLPFSLALGGLSGQTVPAGGHRSAAVSRTTARVPSLGSASLVTDLRDLTETVAIPGYERALADRVMAETQALHPQRDALGDVLITFGTGAPHRVIAVPMDEPGYVVSKITGDGYLRVQRLPQSGLPLHYNDMMATQPVLVRTGGGKLISGIVAGESIHLLPGRHNVPDLDDLDNFYIDLGAQSAAEVERAGVEVLSPIAAERHLLPVGAHEFAGTAVGDRFAAATALELLRGLDPAKLKGSVTFAFVVQQWNGGRGLSSVLNATHPEELLYLGRAMLPRGASRDRSSEQPVVYRAKLGSGVWICESGAKGTDQDLIAELKAAAAMRQTKLNVGDAAPVFAPGYGGPVETPARTVHLAIPLEWPTTAGETLDEDDLQGLVAMLEQYLQGDVVAPKTGGLMALTYPPAAGKPTAAPTPEALLRSLILSYGVSENEGKVRETVQQLLPPWAKTTTDAGGNLILHLGGGKDSGKPGIVLMAHTDELGFRVSAIQPNGSLELENKGGGAVHFYWGHPAIVHTGSGIRAGVLELPENYDTPAFKWPTDFRSPAAMSVGAGSPEEVAKLGIHVGDTVTIVKDYRTLLGTRVSARSLDDRVGCAALVRAAWLLGPNLNRDVTLVWSTREELGLLGAVDYAKEAAAQKRVPSTVFAIDTFVSSDSPIESQRFADAEIGKGFVIRAIDNSNVTPTEQVNRLRALAKAHHIPVQYGVTGGGNDGAAFTRYGAVDVPLAWPLRYSHSPGELIDTRDMDGLAAIVTAIAREW